MSIKYLQNIILAHANAKQIPINNIEIKSSPFG